MKKFKKVLQKINDYWFSIEPKFIIKKIIQILHQYIPDHYDDNTDYNTYEKWNKQVQWHIHILHIHESKETAITLQLRCYTSIHDYSHLHKYKYIPHVYLL